MFLETLECRVVLSCPSESESLMLTLVNRARANPVSELERFNMDLNEGLPPGTISSFPKYKLIWNSKLNDIARSHAEYLMHNGLMTHISANGDGMYERVTKNGVQAKYVDENAGVIISSVAYNNLNYGANRLHDAFVTDTSLPGRGHRQQMLDPKMRQIGISVINGLWNNVPSVIVVYDMIDTKVYPFNAVFSEKPIETDPIREEIF